MASNKMCFWECSLEDLYGDLIAIMLCAEDFITFPDKAMSYHIRLVENTSKFYCLWRSSRGELKDFAIVEMENKICKKNYPENCLYLCCTFLYIFVIIFMLFFVIIFCYSFCCVILCNWFFFFTMIFFVFLGEYCYCLELVIFLFNFFQLNKWMLFVPDNLNNCAVSSMALDSKSCSNPSTKKKVFSLLS